MKKLALTAIILGIISSATCILKVQYDKTPLSLAKRVLENPEPRAKIEVFFINNVSILNNELYPKSAINNLKILSDYLKQNNFKSLTVEGHTTKKFPEAKNKVLSYEIANAVKFYFTNNMGFKDSVIKSRGLGSKVKLPVEKVKNTVVLTIRR